MLPNVQKRPGTFIAAVMAASMIFFLSSPAGAYENIRFIREIKQGLLNPVDVAVDPNGQIFVVEEEPARISVFDAEGQFQRFFNQAKDETARLRWPRSLAVSPRGRLVVADTGNDRVVVFNKGGARLFEFGAQGKAVGQFQSPVALAVDHFGFIFVADQDNQRVQIFTPNGLYFDSFPLDQRPADIAVDRQRTIHVLVPDISRVVRYDTNGQKLDEVRCVLENDDQLTQGRALTVDRRGDIFVSEHGQQSVKKFDGEGEVLISFGSSGQGRGQFQGVGGMTTDQDGRIFIADSDNQRVQVFKITGSEKSELGLEERSPLLLDFDSTVAAQTGLADIFSVPGKGLYMLGGVSQQIVVRGRNRAQVGGGEGEDSLLVNPQALFVTMDGRMTVADTGRDRVLILSADGEEEYDFGQNGQQASQFDVPQDVAVNGLGHIYVADTENHRVQIFNHDGIYLSSLGNSKKSKSSVESALLSPAAIAIDSSDRVFVLDASSQVIKIFDSQGQYIRSLGSAGEEYGQFKDVVDIAFDENDRLYVAEKGNHRVQIFDRSGEWIMAFGSQGKGGGYFQDVSAVCASEGKVYVADKTVDYIQVFRYAPDGTKKGARIYATQTAQPHEDEDLNMVVRYGQARQQALNETVKELSVNTGLDSSEIKNNLRIESVSSLNNGQMKVTVSIPKSMMNRPVPKEEKGAEGLGEPK